MRSYKFHLAFQNIKRLRDIVTIMTKHGFRPLMEMLRLTRIMSFKDRLAGRKLVPGREELTPAVRARLALESKIENLQKDLGKAEKSKSPEAARRPPVSSPFQVAWCRPAARCRSTSTRTRVPPGS